MWKVNILTLIPESYPGILGKSVLGRAENKGIWTLNVYNLRDYALDKHKTVDDSCYGGGSGMVLRADVMANAIDNCFDKDLPIIYPSPKGRVFNQGFAKELTEFKGLNIICGRFEGVDERVFLEYDVAEVSIGDYVMTGGDLAAAVVIDVCVRLLDGTISDPEALKAESFGIGGEFENLLEYPHYTKPPIWRGHEVPDVLLSGNHAQIAAWRLAKAKEITKKVRPDLLDRCLNKGDKNGS